MYGYSLNKPLPEQNAETVRRLSMRWLRAADSHNVWAKQAKLNQNFKDGKQWTDEQIAAMIAAKRPYLTINRINALVRLISGYQRNNRMDIKYQPSNDGQSSDQIATLLDAIVKTECNRTDANWVDSEVFDDGIVTGRGWWDMRLDFTENDLGEIVLVAEDPFSVFVDPDCDDYDLTTSAYLQKSRWVSPDQIFCAFGKEAYEMTKNAVNNTVNSITGTVFGLGWEEDITPDRFFGLYGANNRMSWRDIWTMDFCDTANKRLRLLDTQTQVTSPQQCFVDLQTGDFQPIPDDWFKPENQYKIQKCLDYAASIGNQLIVGQRPVRRIRWTVTCGDLILHDSWSPYESYTLIPFFPDFRRGQTRGVVDDLIDPQREINKKRSSITEILNRSANSGWIYGDQALSAEQEENLRLNGSRPGINIKYKDGKDPPKRLEAGGYPQGLDRLEDKAALDLNVISGINESAMGQIDKVQSGRAIEARQRQAVLALQPYLDNFSRSKKLQGRKWLELIQNHYTEKRIFRITGEDGSLVQTAINQKAQNPMVPNAIERINDVTVGKYNVSVDETPMSVTFKEGQFAEALDILAKLGPVGEAALQSDPSLLISMSSLPQKDKWTQALQAGMAAQQQAAAAAIPGGPVQPGPATTPPPQITQGVTA
jgi:hypothetical protein